MKLQVARKGVLARLGRFELPASGSGDQRSIQLSYRRVLGAPTGMTGRGTDAATTSDLILPRLGILANPKRQARRDERTLDRARRHYLRRVG